MATRATTPVKKPGRGGKKAAKKPRVQLQARKASTRRLQAEAAARKVAKKPAKRAAKKVVGGRGGPVPRARKPRKR